MTDQELQELKDKHEELKQKRLELEQQESKMRNKISSIEKEIKEEEIRKNTEANIEKYCQKVKNLFTYERTRKGVHKLTEELWCVEVDGEKIKSRKGKYTWTSENRAYRGICDYLFYSYDFKRMLDRVEAEHLDIGEVVNKLIDEGYIVLKQIL